MHLHEGVGDGMAGHLGEKDVGIAGIVLPVSLHHDALGGAHSVVGEQAVQIAQGTLFSGAGHDQQLSARFRVAGEHLHLLLDLLLEIVGQSLLAMSLHHIQLGEILGDHIVDGGGNGTLPVKGGVVGVGVDIGLLDVDVVVPDEAAALPALHHEAVVLHRLAGVLLGKGGIDVGILLDHRDVVGEAVIFVQEGLDHIVLLAGLDDPVDGHVLLQRIDHHLGVAGDGVELAGADVIFRQIGRQSRDQDIQCNQDGQHHRGGDERIGASLEGDAVSLRPSPVRKEFPAFHQ